MAKVTNIQIEYINIEKLTPYQKNTRKHGTEDVKKIAKSISKHGMCDPIGVWGEENIIVEGHGRYAACKSLGIEMVPVLRLDEMTDKQRREYAIAHNRTAEFSEWDFDILKEESKELDFSDFDFDFEDDDNDDEEYKIKKAQFEEKMASGELSEDDEEYQEFLQKFEAKKTTDDCYTPELIYETVADYVADYYKLKKSNFVRPFYPGGDYQREKYKKTDVVVDNPPFSILSEIVRWYNERGIKFFLFAPSLTVLGVQGCCAVVLSAGVTYENRARVSTSFVTNLEDNAFRSDPKLYKAIEEADKTLRKEKTKELPKYVYPKELITATVLAGFSKYGIEYKASKDECQMVRGLDCQKEHDKAIYGCGYLISEELKAEREKAEREKVDVWELSEREREIVSRLSRRQK